VKWPVSRDTWALNPHLAAHMVVREGNAALRAGLPDSAAPKRLRQDRPEEPAQNALELDFRAELLHRAAAMPLVAARLAAGSLVSQRVRLRLANGAWYKVDHFAFTWPRSDGALGPAAWEMKGPEAMRGVAKGKLALKVAAAQYPQVEFWLVWRDGGGWAEERVLP